ncbi:MAG: metalloregulator ArsR/SmtB family transcription factor [Candidatus Thermoplasmatota archaeon]|jgi:ArsR family transcriptional regulator|nr:metalloregulator ArsR/SmtB family transcription factor [Candidatus Thermoplasmatota archaeon]MCL5988469.1 metalloregulator ArsR/SmtB family transcription factor [Candidatus Thermoplasmatota archaeon]
MSDEVEQCEIKKIENVDVEEYDRISRILNVLGNKTRIAILAVMSKYKETCACELQPALRMPQPTITTHLRKMYDVGLLKRKEIWKFSYYYVSPQYEGLVSDILKNQTKTGDS